MVGNHQTSIYKSLEMGFQAANGLACWFGAFSGLDSGLESPKNESGIGIRGEEPRLE